MVQGKSKSKSKSGRRMVQKTETDGAGFLGVPSKAHSEVSNVASNSIDESLLVEFLEEDGVDVSTAKFLHGLSRNGLRPLSDPRFKDTIDKIKALGHDPESIPEVLSMEDFKACLSSNMVFITQALCGNLVIPQWCEFTSVIKEMFDECKSLKHGKVADLTPQMAKVDPEKYAISICTVDGQRLSLGDSKTTFPIQDLNRVLLYALTCTEKSVDYVHQYIGKEPSGSEGEALNLKNKKPHNPLLLTGGLTMASLMKPSLCFSERFEYFLKKCVQFCGKEYVGFNNSLALSLKDHSNRLYAIGHYLRENGCFNNEANADSLEQTMELFIHYSAIDMSIDAASVMAATLASGGLCPLTGEKVVYPEAVRNCLSMMNCCGVNDYSGEFMFEVGLPAKSNVSGALMVVIPNVLGMCIYSPRLDRSRNSVRGVQFCKLFTDRFVFHQFDPSDRSRTKIDPRRRDFHETKDQQSLILLFAAYQGTMTTLYRYLKEGVNFAYPDYDGRTAIHLAVCGGQLDVVKFLIDKCHVDVNPIDRWENTPLDDAFKYNHEQIITLLKRKGAQTGAAIMGN
ncbi:glutaminase kidney isoform, mitochondrial-like [Bolinopsis microptera]|uniref:glutaminase kidney isoform, mitochondrial-like n=1 Tax=Bolinopsis microptera TaxID=2820187 RepID=UPI00307AC185